MKPKGESFILKYFNYSIKLIGPVEAQVCCLSTAAVISASTLSSVCSLYSLMEFLPIEMTASNKPLAS